MYRTTVARCINSVCRLYTGRRVYIIVGILNTFFVYYIYRCYSLYIVFQIMRDIFVHE